MGSTEKMIRTMEQIANDNRERLQKLYEAIKEREENQRKQAEIQSRQG